MQIPIPHWLSQLWDSFGDWGDHTLWRRGRIEVLRIDLLLVAAFAIAIGYYGYYGGWKGALSGAVVFTLVATCALMLRK
jgi:hypothetical protein